MPSYLVVANLTVIAEDRSEAVREVRQMLMDAETERRASSVVITDWKVPMKLVEGEDA